jgi:hypothetical protein
MQFRTATDGPVDVVLESGRVVHVETNREHFEVSGADAKGLLDNPSFVRVDEPAKSKSTADKQES